jgi:2-amino-4-hydroxy-6-hydroxymethyldihydropteridine diphosphokinase
VSVPAPPPARCPDDRPPAGPSTQAYVGLGGNLGDVPATFRAAREALQALSTTRLRASALYTSEPWGDTPGPAYLNQVAALTYGGAPVTLMTELLAIEARLGRVRSDRNAPRTLDLDLLTFGDLRCETPALTLPHPRLHLRRFVLLPWSEIAPDATPPGLGRAIVALLHECPDPGRVWPFSG